jgi:hypothetical protein
MTKKEPCHIKPLNKKQEDIINSFIEEYNIKTAEDIQETLKILLGGTIKSMVEAERQTVSVMRSPGVQAQATIITVLKRKLSAVIAMNLSLEFHKIATVALFRKSPKSIRKTSQRLTKDYQHVPEVL